MARSYTYDLDSNRLSVSESGQSFYYRYDTADTLIDKSPHADHSGASAFGFDSLGQLTTSQPSAPGSGTLAPTTYQYDPAGHLACISTASASQCSGSDSTRVVFAIDAIGRHASQTIDGGATTSYAYLGTSDTVSSSLNSGVVSYSAIDAIGDRLTTASGSAFGYLLPDLHGNVVGVITSGGSPSYTSAYRYDAYGETVDVCSGSITSPWRFQGRILESATGSTDLYDFQARSYDPSLGAFTSFDSVAGSAQNPLTLNRYLYAAANPATLVDPDGHAVSGEDVVNQYCYSSYESGTFCVHVTSGKGGTKKTYRVPIQTPISNSCSGHDVDVNKCNYSYMTTGQSDVGLTSWEETQQPGKFTPPNSADVNDCGNGNKAACIRVGLAAATNGLSEDAWNCLVSNDKAEKDKGCLKVGTEVTGDALAVAAVEMEKHNGPMAAALLAKARSVLKSAGLGLDDRDINAMFKGLTKDVRQGIASLGRYSEGLSKWIGVFGAAVDDYFTVQECNASGGSWAHCSNEGTAALLGDMGGALAMPITAAALCPETIGFTCLVAGVGVGWIVANQLKGPIGQVLDWWTDLW